MREGMAIGMMATYAHLAESIQKLPIHTEVTVFQEKIVCLDSLEENGFIVEPIRSRLQQLLEIKANYTKSALKRVELDTGLVNKERENKNLLASANTCDAELEDIRKRIAVLKEKEEAIMKERAGISSLTAQAEHDISRLREEIFSISRSHEQSLEEFGCVISKPLY
jgi:chromosome segregation ATPase